MDHQQPADPWELVSGLTEEPYKLAAPLPSGADREAEGYRNGATKAAPEPR